LNSLEKKRREKIGELEPGALLDELEFDWE
jgi:hypothetical protein